MQFVQSKAIREPEYGAPAASRRPGPSRNSRLARSVPTISRWHPLLAGCWLFYVLVALAGGTYSAERPSHQHD
jgi:hypothetical protein